MFVVVKRPLLRIQINLISIRIANLILLLFLKKRVIWNWIHIETLPCSLVCVERALEQFPMLRKDALVGAIVYYDGKPPPALVIDSQCFQNFFKIWKLIVRRGIAKGSIK